MSAGTEASGDPQGLGTMSFKEHLRELRGRLLRIMLALLLGFFVAWEFRLPLFDFLARPIADALANNGIYQFRAMQLTESVVVYMKTALIADVFFLSPYIFHELWGFISPALYDREKRFVMPLTAFSVFFFVVGAGFAWLVLLPFVTDWLVALTLEGGHVDVLVTLANTYSFALSFLLMFGLVFELPLVIFFLALWGVVTGRGLLKFWRYFVVLSFLISGILTPPDPLSQIFMAVPLNGLYGLGVIVAWAITRAREKNPSEAGGKAVLALSLAVLGAVGAISGALLIIRGLPQAALSDLAPADTAFAVGFAPHIIGQERAVTGLIRSLPDVGPTADALAAAGYDVAVATDGLWFETASGLSCVHLRGAPTEPLLGLVPGSLGRVEAAIRDEDTLLLAPSGELAGCLAAELRPLDEDDDDASRLLRRQSRGGPIWGWLPVHSPLRSALLGEAGATDLGAVGATLAIMGSRALVMDLPLRAGLDHAVAGPRVSARLEAARVQSLAPSGTPEEQELVAIVGAVVDQLPAATPEAASAVAALRGRLARLTGRSIRTGEGNFPPLFALSQHLRGVSVRLEEGRLEVGAELSDGGLAALLRLVSP
jgi:sec-independent protein translocase protein TatC